MEYLERLTEDLSKRQNKDFDSVCLRLRRLEEESPKYQFVDVSEPESFDELLGRVQRGQEEDLRMHETPEILEASPEKEWSLKCN